jgi:hypothetical protein
LQLEDLKPDVEVRGILPGEPVRIIAASKKSEGVFQVYFSDPQGGLQERMVTRADEASLLAVEKGKAYSFDADPLAFKLATEAQRIQRCCLRNWSTIQAIRFFIPSGAKRKPRRNARRYSRSSAIW